MNDINRINRISGLIIKEVKYKQLRGEDLSPEEKEELQIWVEMGEGNKEAYNRLTNLDYLNELRSIDLRAERKKIATSYNQYRYEISKKRLIDRLILRWRLFFNITK